jgi:hypothetical protein
MHTIILRHYRSISQAVNQQISYFKWGSKWEDVVNVKGEQNISNLLLREVNLTLNLHAAIAYRQKTGIIMIHTVGCVRP